MPSLSSRPSPFLWFCDGFHNCSRGYLDLSGCLCLCLFLSFYVFLCPCLCSFLRLFLQQLPTRSHDCASSVSVPYSLLFSVRLHRNLPLLLPVSLPLPVGACADERPGDCDKFVPLPVFRQCYVSTVTTRNAPVFLGSYN